MTSDSEHTNRQRPPQQARGHQWPILVLLLGVATLTLALTACGGSSSTSTPGATTGSPPTATSTPASTSTPKPTEAAAVSESAGISRETREYLEALCALQPAEQGPATWGTVADRSQKAIDFVEKNEPPEELRDVSEASMALDQLIVRFAKDHRSLSYEDEEAWNEYNEYRKGPEMAEALRNVESAHRALDAAVLDAMEAISASC